MSAHFRQAMKLAGQALDVIEQGRQSLRKTTRILHRTKVELDRIKARRLNGTLQHSSTARDLPINHPRAR